MIWLNSEMKQLNTIWASASAKPRFYFVLNHNAELSWYINLK